MLNINYEELHLLIILLTENQETELAKKLLTKLTKCYADTERSEGLHE